MNKRILALIAQEGGRLVSEVIRNKDILFHSRGSEVNTETLVVDEESDMPVAGEMPIESANSEKATVQERREHPTDSQSISKGTACIPCVNDHLSTCAGLVSDESVRMARRNGVDDDEVVRRILHCSDQLNAMEREDLSVEKIVALPDWEKEIAIYAQNQTADIRHKLNNINTADDLESVAILIVESRDKIGKEWMKGRIKNMNPSEKAKVREKAQEILDKELG